MKFLPLFLLLCTAAPLVAQRSDFDYKITDSNGNELRNSCRALSNGKEGMIWELVRENGTTELVHQWTPDADKLWAVWPKNFAVADPSVPTRAVDVGMGYPAPRFFHVHDRVLDVIYRLDAMGGVAMAQFEKQESKWRWMKWSPLDYAENTGSVEARWLAEGKWEVRGSVIFELLGMTHPEIQVVLKDGVLYPPIAAKIKTVDPMKAGPRTGELSPGAKGFLGH